MRWTASAYKTGMIGFWIVLFIIFLYLPSFVEQFITNRSITIFTWPLLIDPKKISQFEKETGIKVHVNYFENSQELLSKIRQTGGQGYDLIIPSDHTLELLIRDGLVKKMDKSKLSFVDDIKPQFNNLYYDPANEYGVPYFWGIYGFGYDSTRLQLPANPSWALVFDKEKTPRNISMTDDAREAIMLSAFYLFGTINTLGQKEVDKAVKKKLIQQKKWVTVYTESRADTLLASNSVKLAVIMSPDLWRIKKEYPHLHFAVPKEGTFIVIDLFALPAKTKKDDLIYQFLNFVYKPEIIEHNMQQNGFCSPLISTKQTLPYPYCPSEEQFKSFLFFKNVVPESLLNRIWIGVMAG